MFDYLRYLPHTQCPIAVVSQQIVQLAVRKDYYTEISLKSILFSRRLVTFAPPPNLPPLGGGTVSPPAGGIKGGHKSFVFIPFSVQHRHNYCKIIHSERNIAQIAFSNILQNRCFQVVRTYAVDDIGLVFVGQIAERPPFGKEAALSLVFRS